MPLSELRISDLQPKTFTVPYHMSGLEDFPFLNSTEFEQACESFVRRFSASSVEATLRDEVYILHE